MIFLLNSKWLYLYKSKYKTMQVYSEGITVEKELSLEQFKRYLRSFQNSKLDYSLQKKVI